METYKAHLRKWGKLLGRQGSLRTRNHIVSETNDLDIGNDDADDLPTIDELYAIFSDWPNARQPESNLETALDTMEEKEA